MSYRTPTQIRESLLAAIGEVKKAHSIESTSSRVAVVHIDVSVLPTTVKGLRTPGFQNTSNR